MRTDHTKTKSVSGGSNPEPTMLIVMTIADTTWRMFVPVLVGVCVGLWVDHQVVTKPLYTFVGLGLGVIVAIALVWLQLRYVLKERP